MRPNEKRPQSPLDATTARVLARQFAAHVEVLAAIRASTWKRGKALDHEGIDPGFLSAL